MEMPQNSRVRIGLLAGLGLAVGALVAAAGFLIPMAHGSIDGGQLSFGQAAGLCHSAVGAVASAVSARIGRDCSSVDALVTVAHGMQAAGILAVLASGFTIGLLMMTRPRLPMVAPPAPARWTGHGPEDHCNMDGGQ